MKKILIFSIIVLLVGAMMTSAVFFSVFTNGDVASETVAAKGASKTFLLAGIDNAGENTDVLMLVSVDKGSGRLFFLQIPRDTYLRTEEKEGKINQLYRFYLGKYGVNHAAEMLTSCFSHAFGIPIDGHAVFHLDAVEEAIDILGGIRVSVPADISYFDSETGKTAHIKAGERRLEGKEACEYLRHRASYTEGDLGRLDAQMRFLSATLSALTEMRKPLQYLRLYQKILPKVLTNLSEKDIMDFATAFIKSRGNASVRIMRMPGEACRGNSGSWYYIVNRSAAERMLSDHFTAEEGYRFDEDGRFVRYDREGFVNIYHAPSFETKIYSLAEASKIEILNKS